MELVVQPGKLRLNIQSGQNLLDVLRDNDVPISYSCMSGRCGTCRCKVTQAHRPWWKHSAVWLKHWACLPKKSMQMRFTLRVFDFD